MITQSRFGLVLALAMYCGILSACGGGGGSGDDGDPPGPPPVGETFSLRLTDLELSDTLAGQQVTVTGLPLDGATATRN